MTNRQEAAINRILHNMRYGRVHVRYVHRSYRQAKRTRGA